MLRLAIICTHPIQYNVPLFRLLSEKRDQVELKVFYTWEKDSALFDKGFGRIVQWDIPLLDGYQYEFISNKGNEGKGFFDVRNPRLDKALKAFQPDAILIYGWNYWSHLRTMIKWKGKVPILFRGDSTLLNERQGLKKTLRRNFLKWIYRHVDVALYVGTNNKEYFVKHGLRDHQLIFAPHAIDNIRFSDPLHDGPAKAWRNELGVPENGIVFLYAGKLEENKDVAILIKAFKETGNTANTLLIIGNGKIENEIKEMADQPNIKWLPFQNQSKMPLVYRLADVFVLPSRGPVETWGLAVNEAMASRSAIIVSDIVGCGKDLVKDGVNGFVFKAGNKEALKRAISAITENNVASMKQASFEIIQQWSYEAQIDAILKFSNTITK